MDKFKKKFEDKYKLNSFLAWSIIPEKAETKRELVMNNSRVNGHMTNGLHMNNLLYLYVNPPPCGYGTPAPKVAETVIRAYEYNRKTEDKEIEIGGYKIEDTSWSNIESFPLDQVSGNYNPYYTKMLSEKFFLTNHEVITKTAEKVGMWVQSADADEVAKGRQTWDPESLRSVTNAKAFDRVIKLIKLNLGKIPITLLELVKCFFDMMNLSCLKVKSKVVEETPRMVYSKRHRIMIRSSKKTISVKNKKIKGREKVQSFLVDHARSFCSYIKHMERGKKDRRAIASAGIFMRVFLKIVEEFHLKLSEHIDGSTISIGGEEKKRKIATSLRSATISGAGVSYTLQGTEDAQKWNECLNPAVFLIMHNCFFNDEYRLRRGLPRCTENELLLKNICQVTFFLMSIKRIHLGNGVMRHNGVEYSRKDWEDHDESELNSFTRNWFKKIKPLLHDKNYIRASPGFLMGMFNAASTTVGLLMSTFIDHRDYNVVTLRSSDDSMTAYVGKTPVEVHSVILQNFVLGKLIGINMSKSKSFFFPEGFGEYTSWYQDGSFIGQCGVETVSLKPEGSNPQEDFNSIAISTCNLMRTFVVNVFGAFARLYVGINNVRRLYNVKRSAERKNISDEVLFLSDGGNIPWDLETLNIDESTLRYSKIKTLEDKIYIHSIMHPENPLSAPPEETVMFSKDTGQIAVGKNTNPINVFTYVKRSNNTLHNVTSKLEAKYEQYHKQALDIATTIDPSLFLNIPKSRLKLSEYLGANLKMLRAKHKLSKRESDLYHDALLKLQFNEDPDQDVEDEFDDDVMGLYEQDT